MLLGQFCHLTLKGSVNRNVTGLVGCVVHMDQYLKMNILLLPFIAQSYKRLTSHVTSTQVR